MKSENTEYLEKTINIRRVTKVGKGGRRFSFSAFVVVGNKKGKVGIGQGKANEVSEAIRKATETAKKNLVMIKTYKNTIPHEVLGQFSAGKLIIKPAKEGRGIIAAGPLRILMECSGIRDINIKSIGTNNSQNMIKAALAGFSKLRTFEETSRLRNL